MTAAPTLAPGVGAAQSLTLGPIKLFGEYREDHGVDDEGDEESKSTFDSIVHVRLLYCRLETTMSTQKRQQYPTHIKGCHMGKIDHLQILIGD